MRKSDLISVTFIAIIAVALITFWNISVVDSFQWEFFLLSCTISAIGLCFEMDLRTKIENSNEILQEKFKLYKIIKNNEKELDSIIADNTSLQNEKIISNIQTLCLGVKKDYTDEILVDMIKNNSIESTLKNDGISRKKLGLIRKCVKAYNNNVDLYEILRQYESKELISRQNISIIAFLISAIGIALSIFAFFRIDYKTIKSMQNIIIIVVQFLVIIVDTVKGCIDYKKNVLSRLTKFQRIFDKKPVLI